jgi:hypothetical protein
MIDVNNCHTHFALAKNKGSLSCHYAAITRQGGRADDGSGLAEPFCDERSFFRGSG